MNRSSSPALFVWLSCAAILLPACSTTHGSAPQPTSPTAPAAASPTSTRPVPAPPVSSEQASQRSSPTSALSAPSTRELAESATVSTSTSAPTPSLSTSASPAAGPALSLVVFGDSWGYGAHCNGCTPWPKLLPSDYESSVGINVALTDLTENGGDSASLVAELKNDPEYRDAIAGADIVIFNMGLNDLEKSVQPAELTDMWTANLDEMVDVVDELRDGKPTAVRMVGVSNEYLTDAGLQGAVGKSGPVIMGAFNKVSCTVAVDHHGKCVDLRPILNGPAGKQPADPNSQKSMDAVSAAIVAVGLDELGVK